jgi:hypothetical protein
VLTGQNILTCVKIIFYDKNLLIKFISVFAVSSLKNSYYKVFNVAVGRKFFLTSKALVAN